MSRAGAIPAARAAARRPLAFAPGIPGARVPPAVVGCLAATVAINLLDWITPAGVVVSILLAIPIVISSFTDDPAWVRITTTVAAIGFLAAAIFGRGPISPAAVWVPNRFMAALALPASMLIALALQRRRLEAEEARDLNGLLMSLLAHDLRSPLVLSAQALAYVAGAASRGEAPDARLVDDTAERVRRSLRALEVVLAVARTDGTRPGGGRRAPLADEVRGELAGFADAARRAGKPLELDDGGAAAACAVNALVVRQILSIVVDNALRYADPGPVRVELRREGGEATVCVSDAGPGIAAHQGRTPRAADASGLGLELARALARRAGGRLELEDDGGPGTTWLLRLPATRLR